MRKLAIRVSLLGLLTASPCAAEDTAVVAATLTDPAAECRYVAQLCADAIRARDAARIELDSRTGTRAETAKSDARGAMKVVRAKHATMPSCFTVRDCAVLFDLDDFR